MMSRGFTVQAVCSHTLCPHVTVNRVLRVLSHYYYVRRVGYYANYWYSTNQEYFVRPVKKTHTHDSTRLITYITGSDHETYNQRYYASKQVYPLERRKKPKEFASKKFPHNKSAAICSLACHSDEEIEKESVPVVIHA